VADVFVAIYEQALAAKRKSPPGNWWKKLYWMGRSRLSKNRNRARRATPTASCAEERAQLDDTFAILAAQAERAAVVRHDFQVILEKARERLTPRARAVLLARVQGFSYMEIAEILGTTPSAVSVHYSNALSKLAEKEDRKNAA
jgi:RNA polymerase sigma factor (sigma-70 family)